MQHLAPPESFASHCAHLNIEISDEEITRLGQYLHLLLETNKQFNLTAIKEPDVAWHRHILDSIALIPFIQDARTAIDVGTGAGLPGIPLAITQPNLNITLLESTGKKAKFCQQIVDQLQLKNITVINDRAETLGQNNRFRESFDVALARAVGPLNTLLELTLPLTKICGRVLAQKGARTEEELKRIGDALLELGGGDVQVYEAMPGVDPQPLVVIITHESKTPKQYPRLPGIPKQSPL